VRQAVDAHFIARLRCRELGKQLDRHAGALRSIEKRLLIKFKVILKGIVAGCIQLHACIP
jgi:hypothetical protein